MNGQSGQPNLGNQTDRKISIVIPIMVAIIGGIFTVIAAIVGNYVGKEKVINTVNVDLENTISENDQKEIDEIKATLYYVQNNDVNKQYYINLLKDIDELELFYKTQICMRYYKYSNIIIAFNEYGINCDDLSITDGTLELWDIECLYIYCQIQENIENSEEKTYLLKDYKMEPLDKCNYKGYGYAYQDETYDEISEAFNGYVDSLVKKMKRNSLPIG